MKLWMIFTSLFLCFSLAHAESFLQKERQKAIKEKKLILLTVESLRCPYCVKMKKEVFEAKKYQSKIAQKYVHREILHDDPSLLESLDAKYLPTNYILSPKTLKIIDEFPGYIAPEHFIELLEEVYKQEFK